MDPTLTRLPLDDDHVMWIASANGVMLEWITSGDVSVEAKPVWVEPPGRPPYGGVELVDGEGQRLALAVEMH